MTGRDSRRDLILRRHRRSLFALIGLLDGLVRVFGGSIPMARTTVREVVDRGIGIVVYWTLERSLAILELLGSADRC